eukprot:80155_1
MDVTISGRFMKSYKAYKNYYKLKNNSKHYPKSAEYARISFQWPGIYAGCTNVMKILGWYYVMNTAESLNETRQKVVTNAHVNRGHGDDGKFEMERIGAGGLSRHVSSDPVVSRIGVSLSDNHQGTPFLQKSQFSISQVMDRRKKGSESFKEVVSF